jgi:phosphatidylglycerophosphate synthase
VSAASEIVAIYRASKKKKDINFWTEWVCRPPAAAIVYLLRSSRVTPNQVTFVATLVALVACALFVALPGWWGAVVAALVFEFSFVLDCVDGQLARLRKQSSAIGHHLDFLMDEIKAFFVFGSITVRLVLERPQDERLFFLVGLGGMACLGAGLAMTTFMRREEYGGGRPGEDGQPAQVPRRRGPLGALVTLIEHAARVVVHYPSYLLIVALIPPGRLDLYFWAYAAVNALYAARAFLTIFSKLGRFA